MLKSLAIIGNIGLLAVVLLAINHRSPKIGGGNFWAFTACTIFIIINFYLIFTKASTKTKDEENVFALWLRVKKAELRKRLD